MSRNKPAMMWRVAAIIATLSFTLAFAQEEAASEAAAEDVVAEAPDAEAAGGDEVAAVEEEEEEDATEEAVAPSFLTPEPTEAPEGATFAEREPVELEPVAEEKPAKVKKVKPPKEPKAPREPREPRDGELFGVGVRGGFGISGFQGLEPYVLVKDMRIDPLLSLSVGGTFSYYLADLVTLSAEAQYTLFTARGEVALRDGKYNNLHKEVVYLHALEFPILARFHLEEAHDVFDFGFGTLYADAGFLIGANVRTITEVYEGTAVANLYRGHATHRVAFGPIVGAGLDLNGTLVGVRFSFNALEYTQTAGGRPWTLHLTVAKNLFEF